MNEQPPEQEWLNATAVEDGVDVFFRLLPKIPPDISTADFPARIEIVWPYESPNDSRLPGPQDREHMSQLEERVVLAWQETGMGYLTMLITGNQVCHWQWYLKDEEQAMKAFNEALSDLPPFPIQIHSENDPNWYSYSNFMKQVKK